MKQKPTNPTDNVCERGVRSAPFANSARRVAAVIAVAFALFHIYTAATRSLAAYQQRGVHLAFALVLAFLLYPASGRSKKSEGPSWVDVCLAIAAAVCGGYLVLGYERIMELMGIPATADLVVAGVMVLLVLEATRRVLGAAITIIAAVFLVYAHFGYLAPSIIAHQGYALDRILSQMGLGTEGIFGTPLGVSATFVIMFIIFAAFLSESGAGQFFIDIAYGLFGRVRGGPAKVAVVASALFGTVSGSAVANVVGTGTFTIPLMKRVGYKPHFAGAVEAVASTGGQIMPPVMGAAAFIMAEMLGMPYISICVAAMLPAVLYYLAVFFMVDLEAVKTGLRGERPEGLPSVRRILADGWFYVVPIIVLVYFLAVVRYSPMRAAVYALVATVAVSFARKSTRLSIPKVIETLKKGATGSLEVALACASAGIVVGVFNLTGLGIRLSSLLIELSHGYLPALLVLVMTASLILGMGLPTTACYIILAVLVAPTLVEMGVRPVAAHMFVFYFGIISAVTPPVALAAYAGASLAGAPMSQTGFTAWRLALAGFILPYMFVYGPELLMIGRWTDIALAAASSSLGVFALATSLQGYLIREAKLAERVVLLIAALLLIKPGLATDLAGLAGIGLVVVTQLLSARKAKKGEAAPG